VDGFIVENFTAGGHNAPPRGPLHLSEKGEPVYGDRDNADLEEIKKLNLPFWLAGSWADPWKLKEALALGAHGIQVGTAFAFCRESGFSTEIKNEVVQKALAGQIQVFTDPVASPTGFPFKVVELENSLSQKEIYEGRPRVCDLGYLRTTYKKEDGTLGYRCPGEPLAAYLSKGGQMEETSGRKCLCNSLLANIGLGQTHKSGYHERDLVTSGDDLVRLPRLIKKGQTSYSAKDVIDYLMKTNVSPEGQPAI
jgi:NAD(P)H-dependent flavin oxidoreductase YrpB (nitropropane dioxygenase family)